MTTCNIGTVLAEISQETSLKHFAVYSQNGEKLWVTDGYKDAELVKIVNDIFILRCYLGYEAYNSEGKIVDCKNYLTKDEVLTFEKFWKLKRDTGCNLSDISDYKEKFGSIEEYKNQVYTIQEEIKQDIQNKIKLYEEKVQQLKDHHKKEIDDVVNFYEKTLQEKDKQIEKLVADCKRLIGLLEHEKEKVLKGVREIRSIKSKIIFFIFLAFVICAIIFG